MPFCAAQAIQEKRPVLWYLSGLTCTHANVMEKGDTRRMAAELGLIIVCPDTSPRGNEWRTSDKLADGQGRGLLTWTPPKSPGPTTTRMYTYITEELPAIISQQFRVDMDRQGIFGHSMGGHGAMTIALKNPDRF